MDDPIERALARIAACLVEFSRAFDAAVEASDVRFREVERRFRDGNR